MFLVIRRRSVLALALAAVLLLSAVLVWPRRAVETLAPAGQGRRTFVIDAGHGGEDGGAVAADGTLEKDLNLAVAQRLEVLLRFLGEDTVMTRTRDVSIHSSGAETLRQKKVSDLKNRVALVSGTPDAILVSIHQNSLPSAPRVHGAQVFYGTVEPSAALARSVQAALNAAVNTDGAKQEKQIEPTIYLMKNVPCPAILVECGFLSNAEETALLRQGEYQLRLAAAIAAGLLQEETENTA